MYGFTKWIDRQIEIDKFDINYSQGLIIIHGLKVKNPNEFYYDYLFIVEKLIAIINIKSFFSNLIVIDNFIIENPKFFLEIIKKSPNIYYDNIDLASKITEKKSDKIWPKKKRDINFLILKLKIIEAKSFIKKSDLLNIFEANLSNMTFYKVGNEKKYQHYKDIFKIILFNIIGKAPDIELKKSLKKIYKIK